MLNEEMELSDYASCLENTLMNNLDKNCPVKTMKIGPQDKPLN